MSDSLPLTTTYFCNAIDSLSSCIEAISSRLEEASNQITQTLLNDRKLIVAGNGLSAPIANILTTSLMHQLEFERPSLPALNISSDAATISAIAKDGSYHQGLSKQVRSLGVEGDTLIALSIDGNCGNIIQAIQTAHEKGITTITIIGFNEGKMSAIKQGSDIEICLGAHSVAHATEAQLVTVNTLCHIIENQLFGGAF